MVNGGSQLKEENGNLMTTNRPTAPPRRKPFTKVNMESTKIPVSSLTVPMGMCAEFKKGQRLGDLFSREKAITLSSFMTGCKGEGVLVTATESQELILECCSDSILSDISIQPVITSSNQKSDARSCNTNNSSQIDLTSSRNVDNKNISRHSLCSSNNSRHSYASQRHHPYPSTITSSKFKITSSSASDNEFSSLKERARFTICPPQTGVATVCLPQVYESSGIYRRQNLPGNLTDTASISHFKEPPPPLPSVSNVPSRFSSMSSSQSSSPFSRAAASRKSIKLSEGLKISPMPTKFNKRSGIILPKSNEYFEVAVAHCQPLISERTQELTTSKHLSKIHSNIKAKMKLYAPSLGVAEITESIFKMGRVYENVIPNTKASFNVAHLLTYPRRTAILSSGYVTIFDNIPGVYPSSNEESVFHTIPSKEYPYYSPHHVSYTSSSAAMNKLQRVTVEPAVESSWHFESSIRPHIAKIIDRQAKEKSDIDQGVVNVKIQKPAEQEKDAPAPTVSVKLRLLKEPELRWAAERCEYQQDFMTTKPMDDLLKPDKAKLNIVTRAMVMSRGEKPCRESKWPLRYDQYSVLDNNHYKMISLGDLKNQPKRPESYYTCYIMQMCAYPLYQSATCSENPILENTNLYCEPTPFKDYAKVTKHSNITNVNNSSDKGFCVAVCSIPDVVDNLIEVMDIPSDISPNEMKKFCQNKDVNESIVEIWIDVLKTRIIRLRPMNPLISIHEPLEIANITDMSELVLEDPVVFEQASSKSTPVPNLSSKYPSLMMPSVIRARAMPLTVQRQSFKTLKELNQSLLYPIEVTECVYIDVFHTTTGPLVNNNINAKKEKCSESRSYIRDYIKSYWSEPIEEFMVLDLVTNSDIMTPVKAVKSVETKMPFVTATSHYNFAFGEVHEDPSHSIQVGLKILKKDNTSNLAASNLLQLQRKPFKIISGIRPVAEICQSNVLQAESILTSHKSSIDNKDQAIAVTQPETTSEWLSSVAPPIDTFWYFKLDTPKTEKKHVPLAEVEPVEELDAIKRPETPLHILGKAKSYQLFLPDPDMIDRLADTFVTEEEAKHADEDISKPPNGDDSGIEVIVTESEDLQNKNDELEVKDLVQGSVKERKPKGERRVMIADPPVSDFHEESPSSMRKRLGSVGKLISYQRPRKESPNKYLRPRPRSRSRSKSRKREEKRKREEEDRQTINDLQNSVQNASYLLDKRRAVGRATYYGTGISSSYSSNETDISARDPDRHRGRARERISTTDITSYSSKDDHNRYSNASMISTNSQDLQPNGSGIRSLLGVAQSWIFNHTSRSERSIDRSKSLLRKSKV